MFMFHSDRVNARAAVVLSTAGAFVSFVLCAPLIGASSQQRISGEFSEWVESQSPPAGEIAGDVPGACGSATLSQNTSFAPGPGVYCPNGAASALTGWARAFALAPNTPAIVNCVDFGVDYNTGGDHTVIVNVLTGNPAGTYGALTLRGSLAVTIPNNTVSAIIKADFSGAPVVVPPGANMVIEVLSPSRAISDGGDGGVFSLGANSAGQSGPGYIRAPACGNPNFLTLAQIGFPSTHILIRADTGPLYWTTVEVENNSGQAAADLHLTFTGTGGTVIVPPGLVMAPGCPNPVVPSNGQVTNTVVIDWNAACVPAGQRVLFLLATPFGPVGFAGGFWTDINGANIGNIAPSRVTLQPTFIGGVFPPPGKVWWQVKRQIRYRGDAIYSPWAKPPGQCWQRWCCFAPGTLECYDRWLLCRFPNLITRFLELLGPGLGNCTVLRGWRLFFTNTDWVWILVVTTIPPPPWERQDPPGGPPPEKPIFFGGDLEELAFERLEVWDSDDQGESSTPSADFGSSFFDVFKELGIPTNNPLLPPILGFNNLAQAMAPRYHAAADALVPLEMELLQLSGQAAHPQVPVMLNHVQAIRGDMHAIANGLATGLPNDPQPYFDIATRLPQLGNALLNASGGSPRFVTAASYLQSMAEGMQTSGQMVLTGLPTPAQQDPFLWGQVARFRPMCEFFAKSTLPHVQLRLDLQDLPSWGPESGQVHVLVQDASTNEDALIHGMQRINEYGHVLLSGFELGGTAQLRTWVKGPTHLSSVVVTPNADGFVSPIIPLVNGDADGNDCIDFDDMEFVLSTQGMGGQFALLVPSSDVNRDGVVSFEDVQIVQAGLGQCGANQPLRCVGDALPDGVVDGMDIAVVLGFWNTAGPTGDLNNDGVVDGIDLAIVLGHWGPCPQF